MWEEDSVQETKESARGGVLSLQKLKELVSDTARSQGTELGNAQLEQ